MRRPVQIVLVAIIVLLVAASAVLFQTYRKTKASLAETQTSEENVRSNYAEAINSIAEIQDSLNAITVGTGNLRMRPQGLAAEQRTPSRQEALESISLLNASIQRTRDKIHQLETNLHKSGVKIAGLERMITDLKASLTTRESQVAELTTQVDSLHVQVNGLQTTVAAAQDTIQAKDQFLEDRRRELATVSYIIGSKRDLKNQGVIVTSGGVLGLGKTPQLSGRYNESLFTNIDTDQETVIHAPVSKVDKVRILSGQPASSYTMEVEGNQVAIHITNPAEFRKVRHLVIMTS